MAAVHKFLSRNTNVNNSQKTWFLIPAKTFQATYWIYLKFLSSFRADEKLLWWRAGAREISSSGTFLLWNDFGWKCVKRRERKLLDFTASLSNDTVTAMKSYPRTEFHIKIARTITFFSLSVSQKLFHPLVQSAPAFQNHCRQCSHMYESLLQYASLSIPSQWQWTWRNPYWNLWKVTLEQCNGWELEAARTYGKVSYCNFILLVT